MNKKLLKRYIKGWNDVAKVEEIELRNTSLRMKFKKTLSIFKLGVGLGIEKDKDADKALSQVRARWCLLKAGS